MKSLDTYEQKLLEGWESIHKNGQLTLWIMLALKDGDKHMAEIKEFIHEASNNTLSADDKSVYRALRRYYDVEMVDFSEQAGKGGPKRKVYCLTPIGRDVLNAFLKRNIAEVYYKPEIKDLITKEGTDL